MIRYRNLQPIAEMKTKLQELVERWNEEVEAIKIKVNTKIRKVIINGKKDKEKRGITCKWDKLKMVVIYEYLGSIKG